MVTLKKKYRRTLSPWFEKDEGYAKIEEVVADIQKILQMKQDVSVLLKYKDDMFAEQCGCCFYNTAQGYISCHVYVHKYSNLGGVVLCLAHELYHAYQIDNKLPVSEDEAEDFSMKYLAGFLVKLRGIPAFQAEGTAKMVRAYLH